MVGNSRAARIAIALEITFADRLVVQLLGGVAVVVAEDAALVVLGIGSCRRRRLRSPVRSARCSGLDDFARDDNAPGIASPHFLENARRQGLVCEDILP